jgi:hypothetical protein
MKRTVVLVGLSLLVVAWLLLDMIRRPPGDLDRGVDGIEFVVPGGYVVLELGSSTLEEAAAQLLAALAPDTKVAAVFTNAGDRVQILVDPAARSIDERVMGRNGTVKSVLWPEAVRERLQWAETHGDFDAPGTLPPQRRNPYH